MIKAKAYTDDRRLTVEFDAAPHFAAATLDEIKGLAECGWGGDYPADRVAQNEACIRNSPDLEKFWWAFEKMGLKGFECHVDEASATAWIREYRPSWVGPLGLADMS